VPKRKKEEKKRKAKLTEVQIRLGRQHQRLRFDAFHGSAEVPVVGFLLRDVAGLPCVEHCEHVFGVWLFESK
jgi:hypothetical protein